MAREPERIHAGRPGLISDSPMAPVTYEVIF
jgi:hypothetical protein